jgi:hypothetical protein
MASSIVWSKDGGGAGVPTRAKKKIAHVDRRVD